MEYMTFRENIERYQDRVNFASFGNGISDEWIDKAEQRLGVKFPPSYVWWLKNYRGGEIDGDEIYSVYAREFGSVAGGDVVYQNMLDRKQGWATADQLMIQRNDQGEDFYFDLSQQGDDGEAPVYEMSANVKYADTFLDFIIRRLTDN